MNHRFCISDIVMLDLGFLTFLSTKNVIVVAVYIPPSAEGEAAFDVVSSVVAKLKEKILCICGDIW